MTRVTIAVVDGTPITLQDTTNPNSWVFPLGVVSMSLGAMAPFGGMMMGASTATIVVASVTLAIGGVLTIVLSFGLGSPAYEVGYYNNATIVPKTNDPEHDQREVCRIANEYKAEILVKKEEENKLEEIARKCKI